MTLALWTYYDTKAGSPLGPPYGTNVYAEFEESGSWHIDDDNSWAQGVYQVDYSQYLNFSDDLKGYPVYVDEAGGNYNISRELPQQHPLFQNFYCSDIDGKHFVPTGTEMGLSKTGTFKLSRASVNYKPLGYAVVSDADLDGILYIDPITGGSVSCPDEKGRFTIRQDSWTLQQIQNESLMQFVTRTTNKALKSAPSKSYCYIEREYTWKGVPARVVNYNQFISPNIKTVLACAGCINSAPFDGQNAGCVLFAGAGAVLRKPILDSGLYAWDMTYRMIVADHGFNVGFDEHAGVQYIYDTINNRWDLITTDGTATGGRLYPTCDLNALFNITVMG